MTDNTASEGTGPGRKTADNQQSAAARTERLPDRLYLIGLETAEPDQIYLWGRDLELGLGYQRPRAYELPYSKSLHEKANEAGKKLRRGLEIIVELDPIDNVTMKTGGEETVVGTSTVRFVDAPEGLVPQKD